MIENIMVLGFFFHSKFPEYIKVICIDGNFCLVRKWQYAISFTAASAVAI